MAVDSVELRKAILHNMCLSEEYCQKVVPFIDVDYFAERSERTIFEEIKKYYGKYNAAPKHAAVKIEVNTRDDLTENVFNEINTFLSQDVQPVPKVDYLIDKTEKWCQERAIVNAVYKAVNVIGGDDKKTSMSSLPDILSKAISTSFDNSIGHDYINDAESRWEFYNKKEAKVSTGITHLDYILRGGLPSKTLGVLLAGTGVGKSLTMCSLSSNLIDSGHNVLYITLEMAEEKIAQRIDQNLLKLTTEELDTITRESFAKRFDALKVKTKGQLVVKEYPTKSAHSGHFRALLKDLKQKKDFVPDLVCIDYLNICASMNAPKGANSYAEIKSIAEELRGLAMEFNVPIMTATQTNRTGFDDTEVTMTSVSESFGVPMTADYFFAITTTDKLKEEGIIKLTQLKNRYSDPNDRKHWLLGVDYAHMKVFDLNFQPDQIHEQNKAAVEHRTDVSDVVAKWG
jgi:replicative DNA helicase